MRGSRGYGLAIASVALLAAQSQADAAPRAPILHAPERVYVTNERSGELSVIDPASHAVVATLPLGKRPRGLEVSPDGTRLYVALSGAPPAAGPGQGDEAMPVDRAADGIGVVDLVTLRLLGVMRGVSDPKLLAIGRDGRRLYVVSEDTATVAVVDAARGGVLATLTVGHEPAGIATSADGRWVYVTSRNENDVTVIDTRDDSVATQVEICARPRAIVFAAHEARAYVGCEDETAVAVVDVTRHAVAATISLPGERARPLGLALSPDDRQLYVTTGRGGRLVAIDTASMDVTDSVRVGARPSTVTRSADGLWLYTANGPTDDVSVVRADTLEPVERIAVRSGPWGTLAHVPAVPSRDDARASRGRADADPAQVEADQRIDAGTTR